MVNHFNILDFKSVLLHKDIEQFVYCMNEWMHMWTRCEKWRQCVSIYIYIYILDMKLKVMDSNWYCEHFNILDFKSILLNKTVCISVFERKIRTIIIQFSAHHWFLTFLHQVFSQNFGQVKEVIIGILIFFLFFFFIKFYFNRLNNTLQRNEQFSTKQFFAFHTSWDCQVSC